MSTKIKFRVAPPFYSLHNAEIGLTTVLGQATMRFTIVDSGVPTGFTTHGNVRIVGDDLGILHNTLCEIEFDSSFDPIGVEVGDDALLFTPPINRFVDLLNMVLDHYRWLANETWLRRIPYRHVGNISFEHDSDDGNGRVGFWAAPMGLSPEGQPSENMTSARQEFVQALQKQVAAGPIPVWLSLWADSRADFLSNAYRSGLAHLYMSLEMLARITYLRLGTAVIGSTVEEHLLPASPDKEPLSISRVVKQCREWAASGPSKSKLTKTLYQAWQYRNKVMHGSEVLLSAKDVDSVITSAEEIARWLESARPLVRRLVPTSNQGALTIVELG